jgi:pimeloyl-ACP methyl ester carboxylesterase
MPLYVNESGPASAPTLVFLHGGGGGGWMWQPQLEAFADYHCLAPDLPEHGRSAEVKPFTIAGSAALIADLIRTRGHDGRAHVVGLSEGAQIIVALLAATPEVVDHAVISSALARPIPGMQFISPRLIAWMIDLYMPFKDSEFWVRANMKGYGVPDRFYPQFKETTRQLTTAQFVNILIENQRFRLPAGLERVTVPTLVVAGKNEYGIMRQSVRDVAAVIPSAKGCLVVHTRRLGLAEEHNWNLAAPELFNQTVRAWLTDSPLPAFLQPVAAPK